MSRFCQTTSMVLGIMVGFAACPEAVQNQADANSVRDASTTDTQLNDAQLNDVQQQADSRADTTGTDVQHAMCTSVDGCGAEEYCDFADNRCGQGAPGICVRRPGLHDTELCPALWGARACACSSTASPNTYESACEAYMAGYDIWSDGACGLQEGEFRCGAEMCQIENFYCLDDPANNSRSCMTMYCDLTPTCDCIVDEYCGSDCEVTDEGGLIGHCYHALPCTSPDGCGPNEYCDFFDDLCGQGEAGQCALRPGQPDSMPCTNGAALHVCACSATATPTRYAGTCDAYVAGYDVWSGGACALQANEFLCGAQICSISEQYCYTDDTRFNPQSWCMPLTSCQEQSAPLDCTCIADQECGELCEVSPEGGLIARCDY